MHPRFWFHAFVSSYRLRPWLWFAVWAIPFIIIVVVLIRHPDLPKTTIGSILINVIAGLLLVLVPFIFAIAARSSSHKVASHILSDIESKLQSFDAEGTAASGIDDRFLGICHNEYYISQVTKLFKGRIPAPYALLRQTLTDEEWALFILFSDRCSSIRDCLNNNADYGFDQYRIREVAHQAGNVYSYKLILLTFSLDRYFPRDAFLMAKEIAGSVEKDILVIHQKEFGDDLLREELLQCKDETIFLTSTTSQVTRLTLDIIRAQSTRVHGLNVFLVSPYILSHTSLLDLRQEYEVPAACIPRQQFILEPSYHIDMIRRVFRIVLALRELEEFSSRCPGVEVRISLFKRAYPGVRLRILQHARYAEIYAGALPMANNMYRFGLSTRRGAVVDKLVDALNSQAGLNDEAKDIVTVSVEDIPRIEDEALRELFHYLVTSGITEAEIRQSGSRIKAILAVDEGHVEALLDRLCAWYGRFQAMISARNP